MSKQQGWSWQGSWSSSNRGFPTLGVFLIVFGLLLVAGQFFAVAEYGTAAFFLAVGALLITVALRDRSDLALYLGVWMAALALSTFLSAGGVARSSGWGWLFVGVGWMGASLWRSSWGRRLGAMFALGALVAFLGAFEVARTEFSVSDRLIGPILLILLGVWIVSRRSRR